MKVLIVGAGVIGTVYGAQLAAARTTVAVLSHGPRTDAVAGAGLAARDVLSGVQLDAAVPVVPDASGAYDIVLVTVRREQLASTYAALASLAGTPAIVFFGNNPAGRAGLPGGMPGEVYLGFPGVGGIMVDGIAKYARIRQQRTALQKAPDHRLSELAWALSSRGLAVQRRPDMDGWLAYHAAFVGCIAAALYRCGNNPTQLAADRSTLTLMCQAITDAFAALRASGTAGLPRNLAVLHAPMLRPAAVRHWASAMRSPMGELRFAAHCRHAGAEMRALGRETAALAPGSRAMAELLHF